MYDEVAFQKHYATLDDDELRYIAVRSELTDAAGRGYSASPGIEADKNKSAPVFLLISLSRHREVL